MQGYATSPIAGALDVYHGDGGLLPEQRVRIQIYERLLNEINSKNFSDYEAKNCAKAAIELSNMLLSQDLVTVVKKD